MGRTPDEASKKPSRRGTHALRKRRDGARTATRELHMDSHTHMQILAIQKPGKQDAIDFSLQTPWERSHCPSLGNFRRPRRSAPALKSKQSHTSGGRKKASRTRATTLGRKKKFSRSRRDVMAYPRSQVVPQTPVLPQAQALPQVAGPSRGKWKPKDGKDVGDIETRLIDDTPFPDQPTTRNPRERWRMAMPLG